MSYMLNIDYAAIQRDIDEWRDNNAQESHKIPYFIISDTTLKILEADNLDRLEKQSNREFAYQIFGIGVDIAICDNLGIGQYEIR